MQKTTAAAGEHKKIKGKKVAVKNESEIASAKLPSSSQAAGTEVVGSSRNVQETSEVKEILDCQMDKEECEESDTWVYAQSDTDTTVLDQNLQSLIAQSEVADQHEPPEPTDQSDSYPKPAAIAWHESRAAIDWHESRRKWVGDQRLQGKTKDPIISWSTTYEDLLSTNECYPEPIPLTEMVDFLVDIWHDEGLFD
ncbi:hypothetical protein ACLB2K_044218 [Fragaria x ananassa]